MGDSWVAGLWAERVFCKDKWKQDASQAWPLIVLVCSVRQTFQGVLSVSCLHSWQDTQSQVSAKHQDLERGATSRRSTENRTPWRYICIELRMLDNNMAKMSLCSWDKPILLIVRGCSVIWSERKTLSNGLWVIQPQVVTNTTINVRQLVWPVLKPSHILKELNGTK